MHGSHVVVALVTAMPHELNGLLAPDATGADGRLVSLAQVMDHQSRRVLRPR